MLSFQVMKINVGSIQRRGRRFYLVVRVGIKNRWIALKTSDRSVAMKRARKVLIASDDEVAWLRHLAQLGAQAEHELKRRETVSNLTWERLWDEFFLRASCTLSESCEASYERWMRILAETAKQLGLEPEDMLKPDQCERIAVTLAEKYISAKRMLVFYRRVYRTVGLDPNLWEMGMRKKFILPLKEREYYRRLSLDEIRKVHASLQQGKPDLADMVVVGYSTGLRLSDVAELHLSEVDAENSILNIVPNKTKIKKPHPIRIPLTPQANGIILRRLKIPDGDGYLFPPEFRKRPSRKIAAAFKSCGVLPSLNGRASFHSLRATFISLMDEAGVPPHVTDSITGHSGGGMHSRYTQPSLKSLRDAVNKAIPPL